MEAYAKIGTLMRNVETRRNEANELFSLVNCIYEPVAPAAEKAIERYKEGKRGWDSMSTEELFELLNAEVEELRLALERGQGANAEDECLDVLNYAAFIRGKLQSRRFVTK